MTVMSIQLLDQSCLQELSEPVPAKPASTESPKKVEEPKPCKAMTVDQLIAAMCETSFSRGLLQSCVENALQSRGDGSADQDLNRLRAAAQGGKRSEHFPTRRTWVPVGEAQMARAIKAYGNPPVIPDGVEAPKAEPIKASVVRDDDDDDDDDMGDAAGVFVDY